MPKSVLAYVFWHWPRADVEPGRYEDLQRRFHAALQAAPSPGYLRSHSAGFSGAAWAGNGGEAYEDWYLVDGSAALDPLNDAAVSASRQSAHDAAAAVAAGGTAGLYRLRSGNLVEAPRQACWFGKPDGMSYSAFYSALQPLLADTGGALWGRQMTLGPTPEFCLHTVEPVAVPEPFKTLRVVLRPIWP